MTKQRWIDAGLVAIGERGVNGLAVEPLARQVGATKGSFYWHFADLPAFLVEVLQHWQAVQTAAIIGGLDDLPREDRLGALLQHSAKPGDHAATLAIVAASALPEVRPVVREVQRQRISYLRGLFIDHGLPAEQATARAHIAHAAYLGNLMMAAASGAHDHDAMHAYLTEFLGMLNG